MHTTRGEAVTFIHDGDFGGEVILSFSPQQRENAAQPPGEFAGLAVAIPFSDLEMLVAEKYRSELIGQIEQLEPEQIIRRQF